MTSEWCWEGDDPISVTCLIVVTKCPAQTMEEGRREGEGRKEGCILVHSCQGTAHGREVLWQVLNQLVPYITKHLVSLHAQSESKE